MTKELERRIVEEIVRLVPAENQEKLNSFIRSRPLAKTGEETINFTIEGYKVAFYQYEDLITKEKLLEIWLYDVNEPIGYVRLDPEWKNPNDDGKKRWEITRAYIRPKYRGRKLSPLFIKIALGLAKKANAFSVTAYPRHVAMLVSLIEEGFTTQEGNYDYTLRRIFRQGRRWYNKNTSARRLYYAQEFRPFIQEGSFIMEKRVKRKTFWDFLLEKI
ncbi:MAG: GNAT family N-acetyltransferase [candidate division WOR-3 bacterium]